MAYQKRRRRSGDIDYHLNDVQLSYFGYNHIGDEIFKNISSKKSNSSQQILNKNTGFRLCGQLPFCEQSAFDDCNDTLIKHCKRCSLIKESLFVFLLFLLELCILIGNFLIIAIGYFRNKKKQNGKTGYFKSFTYNSKSTYWYVCHMTFSLIPYFDNFEQLTAVFYGTTK